MFGRWRLQTINDCAPGGDHAYLTLKPTGTFILEGFNGESKEIVGRWNGVNETTITTKLPDELPTSYHVTVDHKTHTLTLRKQDEDYEVLVFTKVK